MSLSREDQARITAAVGAAEARTRAEFVCVFARRSAHTPAFALLWAAALALLTPWLLMMFTRWTLAHILVCQVTAFLLVAAIGSLPSVAIRLAPRRLTRQLAFRAAAEQFVTARLSRAPHRAGVLIFVSMAERYAHIIPDGGALEAGAAQDWRDALDALLPHLRDGRPADGFVAAVELCGERLAAKAPRRLEDVAVLPNRVVIL